MADHQPADPAGQLVSRPALMLLPGKSRLDGSTTYAHPTNAHPTNAHRTNAHPTNAHMLIWKTTFAHIDYIYGERHLHATYFLLTSIGPN